MKRGESQGGDSQHPPRQPFRRGGRCRRQRVSFSRTELLVQRYSSSSSTLSGQTTVLFSPGVLRSKAGVPVDGSGAERRAQSPGEKDVETWASVAARRGVGARGGEVSSTFYFIITFFIP